MRHVSSGSRSAAITVSMVVSCGVGLGSGAIAQEKPAELPPLEVTAKPATKKKKAAAAAPAPQAAPVEQPPAPQEPKPRTVSAEPSIGTNTVDITSEDLNR